MEKSTKISVSIVLYKSDFTILKDTVQSCIISFNEININNEYKLKLIFADNSPIEESRFLKENLLDFLTQFPTIQSDYLSFPKNPGFAFSHNQCFLNENSDFHLILNPDILLDPSILKNCVEYLNQNPDTNVVFPRVYEWDSYSSVSKKQQFLIKSYPSMFVLLLRGFAPFFLKQVFKNHLDRYECKNLDYEKVQKNLVLVSGCFFFSRTKNLQAVKGLNEKFFLYFEDYDLSLRMGKIDYIPSGIVYHKGGNASKKGWKHIYFFLKSMITFFNLHGYKYF